MATWASLTDEQRDTVVSLDRAVRGAQTIEAKLMIAAAAIGAAWNGGVGAIVAGLDAGTVIPNTSGLDGAQSLSQADLSNLAGYLVDMSNPANNQGGGGYNTAFHQALRVKASGINGQLGQ